jgi:hypothetical protein
MSPFDSTARKRTSSTAEFSPSPKPKRRLETPHQVYLVKVTMVPEYGEESDEIRGIYATIKDANNALKGIANEEFAEAKHAFIDYTVDNYGRLSWVCTYLGNDLGGATIEVEAWELKPDGSEPERELIVRDIESSDEEGDESSDDG